MVFDPLLCDGISVFGLRIDWFIHFPRSRVSNPDLDDPSPCPVHRAALAPHFGSADLVGPVGPVGVPAAHLVDPVGPADSVGCSVPVDFADLESPCPAGAVRLADDHADFGRDPVQLVGFCLCSVQFGCLT